MPKTPSTMLPLGTHAPDFALQDVTRGPGSLVTRDGIAAGRPLLVMFLCNHCPFVKHVRQELASLARDVAGRIGIVGISSNDIAAYPDDAPDKMSLEAAAAGYSFPYCFDETQNVAKAYRAACTPDFFLFDKTLRLVYRGQLDDSRPGSATPVTGADLRAAIHAVLSAKSPAAEQRPSIGCNIKWKPGHEPDYARPQ
jgi:thiol-disulfide isomerase/thioredoxin